MTYSQKRLKSLADEWEADYPYLHEYADTVCKNQRAFPISEYSEEDISDISIKILRNGVRSEDAIHRICEDFVQEQLNATDALKEMIKAFYRVGIFGLKESPHLNIHWSYVDEPLLSSSQLKPESILHVHPTFWMALGIRSA